MNSQPDPRIAELVALAREEGIKLPMRPALICWFEDRGRVVCLTTGKVYCGIVATPTPSAKAVAHLLQAVEGDLRV